MRWTLSLKLVLWLGAGLAAVFGVVSYFGHVVYRETLEESNTAAAERIGDVIKRATRHSMMKNARDDLYFTITSIGAQPALKRIRIFNPEGRISFSTQAGEAGQMVDKSAEACYACHSQSSPLTRLTRPDRVRFFREASGERVLGVIHPIENEPDCSNAGCHAHPPSQRVLGVLDVQLSMAAADAHVAAYMRRELLIDAAGMAVLLGLCAMLVSFLVHIPVRALMEGTRRFAAGDLAYRIPAGSRDELGALAASFNRMGAELQKAREQLARWTETLEERVAQKTAQVQQAVERMAEMDRLASLGKLAAAVAHEINNPLAGVLTYAKLLSRRLASQEARAQAAQTGAGPQTSAAAQTAAGGPASPEAAEQREWLHIIESETLRCGSLVKNLLTFARELPMQVKPTDLNAVLDRCLRLVQHQLKLQNIQWEWKPAGKLEVTCDPSRIQQALLAIVVNAIEVMPHGGMLRLAARGLPAQSPTTAEIEIADNGPGIAPEVLPHIFEPFFSTKEQGQSIGMGLAVAYGILRQHGGEIRVESEAGRGTAFFISLPVECGAGQPSDPALFTSASSASRSVAATGERGG